MERHVSEARKGLVEIVSEEGHAVKGSERVRVIGGQEDKLKRFAQRA